MKHDQKPFSDQALSALQEAANNVVKEAKQAHDTVVVWENGAVRHIPADQLSPTKLPLPGPLSEKQGT